jgi:hypothetical protein
MSLRGGAGAENEIPIVWFAHQSYDSGARVSIIDAAAQAAAGAAAGNVVGYDASEPRPGEPFVRVLVQPDSPTSSIIALPPHVLRPEAGSDRLGLARSILARLEQNLLPAHYAQVQEWLRSDACRSLCANPETRRQRITLGSLALPGLVLPGLVLPELAELAAQNC